MKRYDPNKYMREKDEYAKFAPLAKKYNVTTEDVFEGLLNAFSDNEDFFSQEMYDDPESISDFVNTSSLKDILDTAKEFKVDYIRFMKKR